MKTSREVFKETLERLGFSNYKPSEMSNSDYWMCSNEAMKEYSNIKNKMLLEENQALKSEIDKSYNKGFKDAMIKYRTT